MSSMRSGGFAWGCLFLLLTNACGQSSSNGGSTPTGGNAGTDAGAVGTGGDGGSTRSDGGATSDAGDGAPATPACEVPPPADFDPIAAYAGPGLTPTVVVTSTADDGAGSLRAAVAAVAAGGVVGFSPELAGETISLASTIQIQGSITIDGSAAPGVILDAGGNGSAFSFNGDSPTQLGFFSMTIAHGNTTGGGGAIGANGGALTLEIGGIRFEDNAAVEGGAVRFGYVGSAYIHDSTFVGNDGSLTGDGFSGGAISSIGGPLHVARCRFDGNKGSTSGAVYGLHADPVIEDSVFVNNQAATTTTGSAPGALGTDGGGPGDYNNGITTPGVITVRRSLFAHNTGATGGAALLYAYPPDTVTVESCVFDSNTAAGGIAGAMQLHADKTLLVTRTAFTGNQATSPGGAIWADGSGAYTFENDLFSANTTDGDLGGALRLNVSSSATLNIASCTFADNTATSGNGAVWIGTSTLTNSVTNTIFSNNSQTGNNQQVNYPLTDTGGNILWPDPGSTPTIPMAKIADPELGPLTAAATTLVRAPLPGSPALGAAVSPAPAVDQRGAPRSTHTDIGSVEIAASCAGP